MNIGEVMSEMLSLDEKKKVVVGMLLSDDGEVEISETRDVVDVVETEDRIVILFRK